MSHLQAPPRDGDGGPLLDQQGCVWRDQGQGSPVGSGEDSHTQGGLEEGGGAAGKKKGERHFYSFFNTFHA